MVRSHDLRVQPALSSDREFLFEVRRAALRAYVEQTSGWDDAEQRVAAAKEFAELPFGTQLLRGILWTAERRGVPVRLSVFVSNPAQALYARLGFEVVRIEDPRMSMRWSPGNA
jgi:ribosomal protein S18 acetylase RimI-like enzyme